MKNILLLTDFSKPSINAMVYAAQLFQGEHCTFYVLNTFVPVALYNAVTLDNNTGQNADVGELFEQHAKNKVQELIDTKALEFPDPKHHFVAISSFNTLIAGMHMLVDAHAIECIIMGTNGATGLKELFIGSQTMHVIKEANIPVIGVPAGYRFIKPVALLFVTDYRTGTKQTGLSLLNQICTKNHAGLIFLNAYRGDVLDKNQLQNKDALDHYFKNHALLTQTPTGTEVLDAIEQFHSRHRIDLLVLVHNKRNFFENLLFTPVVQKVVHHAHVPFLILPPTQTD